MEAEIEKSLIQATSLMDQIRHRSFLENENGFDALAKALKYPETLSYVDFLERYERQDIANRVVSSPVDATWATDPKVGESVREDTPFEKGWNKIVGETSLFSVFSKVDLLGRLGHYAVLFLGASDGTDLSKEIKSGSSLKYINALPEPNVKIVGWEDSIISERFGAPKYYDIQIETNGGESVMNRTVHWSRIIHIAQDTVSNKYYGIPSLLPIYNRLLGLEKLASGSPEMYWRGARPGYVASSGGNVLATDKQIDDFKVAISDFVNNLNRYLYAEDLKVHSLAPQVVTPREHVDVQLQLISAAMRIPLRILIGSERGELSSDQDERAWLNYIESRRDKIGKKLIISPFIDRLLKYNMLEPPKNEYFIRWEPLVVLSDKDRAEVARLYSDAIKKYDDSITARDIIPPDVFKKYILSLDEEAIALSDNILEESLKEEDLS